MSTCSLCAKSRRPREAHYEGLDELKEHLERVHQFLVLHVGETVEHAKTRFQQKNPGKASKGLFVVVSIEDPLPITLTASSAGLK